MTSKIESIKAREILDSRGNPTVEVELITNFGKFSASVPSGASKGRDEAVALNTKKAINNVNKIIAPKLKGKDVTRQREIDNLMIKLDGTKNKSKLGGNALVGVSLAVCRAGAKANNLPLWKWISKIARTQPLLPTPCILFIEGGLHSKGDLGFQEFMAYFPARSFKEKFKIASDIYKKLGQALKKDTEKEQPDWAWKGLLLRQLTKLRKF